MNEQAVSGWKLFGRDPDAFTEDVQRLLDEATAASPPGFLHSDGVENTIELLPRRAVKGTCRLCGAEGELTKEHIPPRSGGNKVRTFSGHSLQDWLDTEDLAELGRGTPRQGGVFGYTLCRSCNSHTGAKYGLEYKNWYTRAGELLTGMPDPALLDAQVSPLGNRFVFGTREHPVKPGAFVRQVLSCMCSLSGRWNLAEKYPALRRIVLDGATEPLPQELELGFAVFLGPRARMCGPQLELEPRTGTWRWLMELAFPPFAFLLVVASNQPQVGRGLMMNDWTTIEPDRQMTMEGIFEIGFGWSPYPGDYRSRAMIERERNRPR